MTEDLARDGPAGAPSQAVDRSSRPPGTTNAPGGEWYSTPAAKRKAKPKNLSLTADARAALAALHERPGGDSESAEASEAILERARRLNVWPAAGS